MKKLGIDEGSSSIGWVVTEDGEMVKSGVVRFDTGMSKGQSGGYESPTRKRREARSKRNLIRARKYRKWELLKILIEKNFVPLSSAELEIWSKYQKGRINKFPENEDFMKWLACDFTYLDGGKKHNNPYEIRVKALDNKLSNHEFGRALYHIVQRRGYKDIGETDKETEKQIERRGESGFQKALNENRTVAEALMNEFLSKNERTRNQYPYRDEYKNELELICQGQGYDTSKNQKGSYNDNFVGRLWKAIIWQRPLKSQKGNIGKCTLEPKKLRCPISHPVFEIFRAWSFINTIKYYDENNEKQSLIPDLKIQLYNELFLKKDSNFKFEEIRKFLDKKFGKPQKYNYPINKKTNTYDTSVAGMPVCKGLINIFGEKAIQALETIEQFNFENKDKNGGFGNAPKIVEQYSIYDLWHILFAFDKKSAKNPRFLAEFATQKLHIDNVARRRKGEEIFVSPLEELRSSFSQGYSDLSLKAMCKIIPFLKNGYLYNEAVALAKMPDLLGKDWKEKQEKTLAAIKEANKQYEWNKTIVEISNSLIDNYKGLPNDERFAYKDFQYTLDNDDVQDVEKYCKGKFGEKSWEKRQNKSEIANAVKVQYQEFFKDEKRAYRTLQPLVEIFDEKLKEQQINIDTKKLYHHSNLENKYLQKCKVENEKPQLPTAQNKDGIKVEVLPVAIIDSIKNPMFNKSMSILRTLINELIKDGVIDRETEVTIELARELNDNNRRMAIERYQNERKNNREKYREFLKEFSARENKNLNIEES
ncbi:MAG: hypothetical protein LBU92_04200, partial [Prevotellaceae bacterium]|nr:hypothetical protein [Prevotellaceae bacterium]